MTTMIKVPLIPFRSRRKNSGIPPTPPPPVALTLVAASFDPDGPEVYLTFDRPIDISGLVVAQFAVTDGPDGHQLVGFETPLLVTPNQAQVLMHIVGSAGGDDVLVTAGAGNGIVASDDGGTWGGVAGLVLPFP